MKRTSLFIATATLLHLVVIDLAIFIITSNSSVSILPVSVYNVVWLLIAITVGTYKYNESREN